MAERRARDERIEEYGNCFNVSKRTDKQMRWNHNTEEIREGDQDTRGIKERKNKIIFPAIFDGSCASSNITEENAKRPGARNLCRSSWGAMNVRSDLKRKGGWMQLETEEVPAPARC
jgi:hypothetical protein